MKNKSIPGIIFLSLFGLLSATSNGQSTPVIKIVHSGKGCIGDSLKINAGIGVKKITWNKDASLLKTLYNNPFLNYGITVAGDKGGNSGTDSTKLNFPIGVYVDKSNNIYVGEYFNNRVQKWAPGARYGITVAGDKTGKSGTDSMHFNDAADVCFDKSGNLYVPDYLNNRVQKWAPGAKYGVTVAGFKNGASGTDSFHLNAPRGLWVDASGNVYVAEGGNNRVSKWAPGASYGVTVAGNKNGYSGTDAKHLNYPCYVYVDNNNNLYVTDQHNNRIQKWAPGATSGVTVAGNSSGATGFDSMHLSNPTSVFVDGSGNIYVGDYGSHRVKKWEKGSTYGVVVAGNPSGNSGADSLHLNHPYRTFVDSAGNIYVADGNNNRIQKWGLNPKDYNTNYIINSTGKYYATITYANGVVLTSDTFDVLPFAKGIASDTSICLGASLNLGKSAVSGYTYSWSSQPVGFTSTIANPVVSPTASTTYKLDETMLSSSCNFTDSVRIKVNPLPEAIAGNDTTICSGENITIGAKTVKGNAYSWVSTPTGFTSTSSSPNVNPINTTSYTLTETITSTGCSQSNTVKINTNPLPNAIVGTSKSICAGDSASFGSKSISGNSYSWTSDPSGFSSTNSLIKVSPAINTNYILTEITSLGCSKTNSVSLTVNANPDANAGTSKSICIGNGVKIGAATVNGDTYNWISDPTGFSSSVSSPLVNPHVTTKYTLTETNPTGCVNSNFVIVTVNPLPDAKTGSDTSICAGTPIKIGRDAISGNTYAWTSDPTGFSATNSNPVIQPSTTTKYTLSETNSFGCSKSNSIIVTVNALPDAHWSAKIHNGNAIFTPDDLNNKYYTWSFGNGDSSSILGPSYTYSKNGTYKIMLVVKNATGCLQEFDSAVNVNLTGVQEPHLILNNITAYPNPFSNNFRIQFNIEKKSHVKLEVINMQGKTIAKLIDSYMNSGRFEEDFNSNQLKLNSGVYYLKFTVDGESSTQKLIKISEE